MPIKGVFLASIEINRDSTLKNTFPNATFAKALIKMIIESHNNSNNFGGLEKNFRLTFANILKIHFNFFLHFYNFESRSETFFVNFLDESFW